MAKKETALKESNAIGNPISTDDVNTPDKRNARRDIARRASQSIAKTFVNKRDTIRLDPGRPERVMSDHKKAAAELINSRTQNQPMKVVVTGVEPVKNPEGGYVMMPVALYNGWKIIIPRDQFITDDMVKGPGTLEEELVKRVNGSVGSEIDIIPTKFLADSKIVVASRLKAMEQQRLEMWFAKNIRGKREDFLFKEGEVAEARVVYVVKGGVTVEVYGVETFIPVSDVAYVRIDNCRGKFKAGDRTRVRITEVIREKDGKVSFKANVKEAYPDPRAELFPLHVVGGNYNGKVTMIETNVDRDSSAYVLLDSGIEVKCGYPKKVLPQIGDRVSVAIRRKDPDTLRFRGEIVHVDLQE